MDNFAADPARDEIHEQVAAVLYLLRAIARVGEPLSIRVCGGSWKKEPHRYCPPS